MLDYTTTERGQPRAYDSNRGTTHYADDRRSRGASTRPDLPTLSPIHDYDATVLLAQAARARAPTRAEAQGDCDAPLSFASSDVAANTAIRVRPPLSIPKNQFGVKRGKHAADYGLDAGDAAARSNWLSKITDVYLNPDEVRVGQYGVYDDAFMFRQGQDPLITRSDGTFVSMYPGAGTSSWFKNAQVFDH